MGDNDKRKPMPDWEEGEAPFSVYRAAKELQQHRNRLDEMMKQLEEEGMTENEKNTFNNL